MDESIFASGKAKMDQVVELVSQELDQVRTGRAKPALVERVKVEAYEGTTMEVREVAAFAAPDPHSLIIKPWDTNVLKSLEKALLKADLGASPVVEGEQVRLTIQPLSQERREELVKQVGQRVESGKAMLRQIRNEVKHEIDEHEDDPGVSEDDVHAMYDRLQSLIDDYNGKLDSLEEAKAKELMEL